jgi:AbrB family looped-hinge helix DNA binding protein
MKVILNKDGRITLPKSERERLGLRPGDSVEWRVCGDAVLISPVARGTLTETLNPEVE